MTLLDDAVGAWLQLPSAMTAELVSGAGFDVVCVDQQHGLVGDDALLPILQAVTVPALVRPPTGAADAIGRALDRGAAGVVVPLVDSAKEAAAAVSACHWPPRGTRSYGPTRAVPGDPLCVVMIETREGVAALPEILEVDGVDAVFIGPSDLALSHGMPTSAQNGDEAYDDLLRSIIEPVRAAGRPVGIFTASAAHAVRFRALGCTFTFGPSEATLLRNAAAANAKESRPG